MRTLHHTPSDVAAKRVRRLASSSLAIALAIAGFGAGAASAAGSAPAALTMLDRYHLADAYLHGITTGLVTDADLRASFTADGKGILYRSGPDGHRMIRYFDIATNTGSAIIEDGRLAQLLAQQLGHPVRATEFALDDAKVDPARGTLTFSWQKHWTLSQGKTLTAGADLAAEPADGLSPDGRYRIVARNFNLVAIDTASGRELPLTTDGTRDQPYGRNISQLADILKQGTEDPVQPVSLAWSPDSKRIFTWRLDTREVKRLTMTQQNPPGSFYPRSFSYVYPLAGAEKLPMATRLIIDVPAAFARGAAKIVPVAMPAEALLYPAAPDMEWIGDRARANWTARGYGQIDAYDIDPATGAARVVARETDKPLVTITATSLQPAPELGGELVISERSGWAQLYLVKPDAPDGGTALTHGAWEVRSVERVDADRQSILLTGAGREPGWNPYWLGLYRISTEGGTPTLLTPEPLDHHVTLSDDGRWGIDVMSSPTTPPETVLRDLSDGHIVSRLGKADARALLASGFTLPEPFQGVAADGKTPLYGMIFRPAHFDPAQHYPMIDEVYTGPTMSIVPTGWSRAIRQDANSVAQLGAIVVMIDARGTSDRGQAFRLPAYRNMGEVGLDDHIAMMRQMAARYPYMDTDKAGVYGCSAGGYDAARFILRRPDFFKVAVATSGNQDLRLDKAWWPEVTMGDADPATWDRVSNMSVAGQLKGKLMIVHGDIDDNVPVTEAYRLEKALIDAGRDVDVVILPNASHCAMPPYFWRKFRNYFVQNLFDETPPSQAEIDAAGQAAPSPTSNR
ncbi:S9 family peptidase [Sphingomonas abietis]|uniref:Prolyl oligopeptidase family serine peptidase n=1 Tax=Sphingomonas abietis TaxID=3012344 RepID=A0ABY7NGZ6_9SPHN|nr:prolyl oligopeptidase family serine peptidase [Sphingomonas abietis]WBO20798.1 prolyl oligopeptidase family serine peptidase [Sphingomonas abietis]